MTTPRLNPVLCWHQCKKAERKAKREGNTRKVRAVRKVARLASVVAEGD